VSVDEAILEISEGTGDPAGMRGRHHKTSGSGSCLKGRNVEDTSRGNWIGGPQTIRQKKATGIGPAQPCSTVPAGRKDNLLSEVKFQIWSERLINHGRHAAKKGRYSLDGKFGRLRTVRGKPTADPGRISVAKPGLLTPGNGWKAHAPYATR